MYEGPWIFVACVVSIFYPSISFSSSFCLWCLLSFWGFSQPSWKDLPTCFGPTLDSGTCSLLVEKSVLASFPQAPAPLLSQSCLPLSSLACGVENRNSLREAHLDFRWGGKLRLPSTARGRFSFILVFHLVLSFCLCSLSLSLCRFCFCLLCLPHPKS